jgi:hypothetical protein
MKDFTAKYNDQKKSLECSLNTPDFCIHNSTDPHKKCIEHYRAVLNNQVDNIVINCPYGFRTVKIDNEIYSGIIASNGINDSLVIKNLKSRGQNLSMFLVIPEAKIMQFFRQSIDSNQRFLTIEDAFHDFKNIMFSVANILEKHEDYSGIDNLDFKTLLGLSDLMRNRLKIIDEFYGVNSIYESRSMQCIHPLFHKLKNMMYILCKKREITINLQKSNQYNKFDISEEVFSGLFIIFENAIKHAIPKSTVYITFDENRKPGVTYIEIENESNLIEEDEVDKLVSRGYRGKHAVAGGNGLGLSKAKSIFEKNKIAFEYEVIKNGFIRSTFKIILKFDQEVLNFAKTQD